MGDVRRPLDRVGLPHPDGHRVRSVRRRRRLAFRARLAGRSVYLAPVLALVAVGAWGVWTCRARVLAAVAVVASTVLVVHLVLAFNLRDRCVPDDPTAPGCAHY